MLARVRSLLAPLLALPWYVLVPAAAVLGVVIGRKVDPAASGAGGAGGDGPAPTDPENVREAALNLLTAYLPCRTGDARFAEIAKDYGGMGTTCGYLTGWLLWRLGCVDPQIVNREEPADGLRYAVGMNIARLVSGGKALGAWRTQAGGARPKPGDLCYYAMDPPAKNSDGSNNWHEHVNVAVDCSGDEWRSADAGRTDPQTGKQMAEFVTRKRFLDGRIDYYGGPRKLIGWVDLTAVPFTRAPIEGVA
jgi:hypothetical protein